jgi:hypothetical protein
MFEQLTLDVKVWNLHHNLAPIINAFVDNYVIFDEFILYSLVLDCWKKSLNIIHFDVSMKIYKCIFTFLR